MPYLVGMLLLPRCLEVFGKAAITIEPGKGAFDNPAAPHSFRNAEAMRFALDSPLEMAGFELSVPGESGFGFAPERPDVGIRLFQRRAGRKSLFPARSPQRGCR